jgi:hypothetical protein
MPGARDWARAFAVQAKADMQAREALIQHADLPLCQELHFLQMACEKLAKAHLYLQGSRSEDIQSSHGFGRKQIPLILREIYLRKRGRRENTWLFPEIRRLANEIALLHPQVNDGGARPDNCEYPWVDAQDQLHTPAEHDFGNLALAKTQAGREFMKLLKLAIDEAAGE